MAGMHHALILASRVLAGIVAAIAFYFAFFLYEDEEGAWQNRIENLWSAVYDRAKVTDSTSTALFNKIGDFLRTLFNRAFGKRLLSFRAIAVSLNLSLGGALLVRIYVQLSAPSRSWRAPDTTKDTPVAIALSIVCFTLSALPGYCQRPWATMVSLLTPVSLLIFRLAVWRIFPGSPGELAAVIPDKSGYVILLFALSVASDFLAIVIMRKLFASLSTTISILRLAFMILALILLATLMDALPILIGIAIPTSHHAAVSAAFDLAVLNTATIVFSIFPIAILVGVLVHKLIWPLLSRLLYPVASRRIIANHPVLISIGTGALAVALNVQQFGWKFIVDHIK
jgi:hypothetical protein